MTIAIRALAAAALFPGSALAGDFADREILGFSPDGSHFAFEEYGVQDGSGFAYSNTFLIDVDEDAWVDGTPIRLRREDETVALAAVRADARKAVRPILDKYRIAPVGRNVVSNPATELSSDPYMVRFLTDLYANWTTHAWTLTLTRLPLPEPESCANLGPVMGFRLTLANPAGEVRTLHEDTKLPASRGCALDYAINDVVTYLPERSEAAMVVLLNVITQGFEGPDRRFLAVATRFQDY